MTIDPRERLRRIDPAPLDVDPPSGTLGAVAVIHEIERRMGMDTRDTTNDTETPLGVTEQIEPGATTTANGTPTKQAGKRRWSGALVAAAAFALVIVVGLTAALLSNAISDAEPAAPAAGPITLKTNVNLGESPVVGTFFVSAGADVLGCSSGTVALVVVPDQFENVVMTCESGPNTGTFTFDYGPADRYVWNVVESSDDFAGLQGEGSWVFVLTSSTTVAETFTGNIEYTP